MSGLDSRIDSGIDEVRARKRAALGLSPHRPTAKAGVERPPDPARATWATSLLPLGLVLIIALTLFLMFGAGSRLASLHLQPDWSWARLAPPDSPLDVETSELPAGNFSQVPAASNGSTAGNILSTNNAAAPRDSEGLLIAEANAPRLRLADNFSRDESIFAARDAAGQWRTEHIPHQGIYRMEVWPTHVVWSLLDPTWLRAASLAQDGSRARGDNGRTGYRMQAAATIAPHTSWGYAGLVARVQEERQLILFLVDGQGQFRVQHMRDGITRVVVPWTAVDALNSAGTGNVLTVEDDGQTMRFFANHLPLFQMRVDEWAPGQVGIAAGAREQGVSEIRFEWFQLYELAPVDAE